MHRFWTFLPGGLETHRAWSPGPPGFEWLTLRGMIADAAWCVAYGFWTALLVVPFRRPVGTIFGKIDKGA